MFRFRNAEAVCTNTACHMYFIPSKSRMVLVFLHPHFWNICSFTVRREQNSFLYSSLKVCLYPSFRLPACLPAYLHVHLCETECNSFRDLHLSTVFKFLVLLEVGWREALWPWEQKCVQGYVLVGKGGRFVGLTTLPPSFADCLEILGTLRACPDQALSFISSMNVWAM